MQVVWSRGTGYIYHFRQATYNKHRSISIPCVFVCVYVSVCAYECDCVYVCVPCVSVGVMWVCLDVSVCGRGCAWVSVNV